MASGNPRPVIFMVSLAQLSSLFDDIHQTLVDRLAAKADLKRASTADAAIKFITNNPPNVVLITDAGIADEQHTKVLRKIQDYTRDGGKTVIATLFSSFISMDTFDNFFSKWNVPWSRGDYERSIVSVNKTCAHRFGLKVLPDTYSAKAVKIKHARTEQVLYAPGPDSLTQSLVFAPAPTDPAQAAVVCTAWGAGSLAYVGDVNTDSDDVIVALCGL